MVGRVGEREEGRLNYGTFRKIVPVLLPLHVLKTV